MSLRITNTLSGNKELFETITPGQVKMYVCGPTVYSEAHIGHAMSAIVFDVIRRYLEYSGYDVTIAQNFTDVDDKIIQRAATLGIAPETLAQNLIEDWLEETAALNVKPATLYPRATQEIPTIIAMIETLIEQGHAYPVDDGDVFYRVSSFESYGKLSNRDTEEMLAGARIDVDPRKENPMDFALWKAAKPGEPAWDSPWGPGRPGWHIECSAMIRRHLGERIDIHGGGADLIFPHHENEIAQSEAYCACEPFSRYWVHNGLLQLSGEKMSKSLGNLITIKQLISDGNGQAFRMNVLSSHYRNPLAFSDESLEASRRGLARLQSAVRDLQPMQEHVESSVESSSAVDEARRRFRAAMDDDFNTPVALSVLFDLARTINREQSTGGDATTVAQAQHALIELADVLGLELGQGATGETAPVAPFVELLLSVRQELRARKQWDLSDRIRDGLQELGITVEDSAGDSTWRWS